MVTKVMLLMLMTVWVANGQRGSFAGSQPIGYPALPDKPPSDGLGNRFGNSDGTETLPLEARGDRDLLERISKMPVDKQPFWYINWKALEEERKNPKTYPQNANSFVDPPQNSNLRNANRNGNSNMGNNANRNSNADLGNRSGMGTQNVVSNSLNKGSRRY